ncbi:hypothetical protein LXL04_005078 [Taraxacum kok-saghyz]
MKIFHVFGPGIERKRELRSCEFDTIRQTRGGQDLQVPGTGTGTGGIWRFRNWNWSDQVRFQIQKLRIWSDQVRFQFQKYGIWYPPGTWYLVRYQAVFEVYRTGSFTGSRLNRSVIEDRRSIPPFVISDSLIGFCFPTQIHRNPFLRSSSAIQRFTDRHRRFSSSNQTKKTSSSSDQFRAVPTKSGSSSKNLGFVPVPDPKTRDPSVPVPIPLKKTKYLSRLRCQLPSTIGGKTAPEIEAMSPWEHHRTPLPESNSTRSESKTLQLQGGIGSPVAEPIHGSTDLFLWFSLQIPLHLSIFQSPASYDLLERPK